MSLPRGYVGKPKNLPYIALGSAVLFVVAGVILVTVPAADRNGATTLLLLLMSQIPSLVAAAFSERNNRDMRNGTVVEKVRLGTHKALEEVATDASHKGAVVDLAAIRKIILEENERQSNG